MRGHYTNDVEGQAAVSLLSGSLAQDNRGLGGTAAEAAPLGAAPPRPFLVSKETSACNGGAVAVSAYAKRRAEATRLKVQHMVRTYGLNRLGFLTLTFPDHVTDIREAQRRWHSFLANEGKRWPCMLKVIERQASGRIHFHFLTVCPGDIRTGFDFAQVARRNYRSAGPVIRSEWAWLRRRCQAYQFGRHELLPVRSSEHAIALYMAKYLTKLQGLDARRDKGMRRCEWIGENRPAVKTNGWAWAGLGGWVWRAKLRQWARDVHGCDSYGALVAKLGNTFMRTARLQVRDVVLDRATVFPTKAHAARAGIQASILAEYPDTAINLSGFAPHCYRQDPNATATYRLNWWTAMCKRFVPDGEERGHAFWIMDNQSRWHPGLPTVSPFVAMLRHARARRRLARSRELADRAAADLHNGQQIRPVVAAVCAAFGGRVVRVSPPDAACPA